MLVLIRLSGSPPTSDKTIRCFKKRFPGMPRVTDNTCIQAVGTASATYKMPMNFSWVSIRRGMMLVSRSRLAKTGGQKRHAFF